MEIILIVVFGLLGTAIGSFLNVCIDRLPYRKSIVCPPSHCEACQHPLSPKDLIPIFSYLRLGGHCRYCQTPIPRRVLWVEIGTGLLFALTYWYYGLNFHLAITAFYCCIFVVIGVIDLEHKRILNIIVYPMAVVALIISIFLPSLGIANGSVPWPESVNGIVGGAIGLAFLLIPALIRPEGMGWGDVKLAAFIGLVVGFPLVIVALLMGAILGGLVAGILLSLKMRNRKETIPFGPFLSITTIVTLFVGNDILNWYLGLF